MRPIVKGIHTKNFQNHFQRYKGFRKFFFPTASSSNTDLTKRFLYIDELHFFTLFLPH